MRTISQIVGTLVARVAKKKIVNIVIAQVARQVESTECKQVPRQNEVNTKTKTRKPKQTQKQTKKQQQKKLPKDVCCPPKGGELPRHRATATTRRVRDDPQGGLRECSQAGRQLGNFKKKVPKPVNFSLWTKTIPIFAGGETAVHPNPTREVHHGNYCKDPPDCSVFQPELLKNGSVKV